MNTVQLFFQDLLAGKKDRALSLILPDPLACLPDSSPGEMLAGNIADALAFCYNEGVALFPIEGLSSPALDFDHYILNLLNFEDESYAYIKDRRLLPPLPWLRGLLAYHEGSTPSFAEGSPYAPESLKKQLHYHAQIREFQLRKSSFTESLIEKYLCPNLASFYPLSYACQTTPSFTENPPDVMVMEPYRLDWEKIARHLKDNTLFVFIDSQSMGHCLGLPGMLNLLVKNPCLVLNRHPKAQIAAQESFKKLQAPLTIHNLSPQVEAQLGPLKHQLEELLENPIPGRHDAFYAYGRQLYNNIRNRRLGPKRSLALQMAIRQEDWFDHHKERKSYKAFPGLRDEFIFEHLSGGLEHRRAPSTKKRPKLAHIVPQLIDGGHAPSRILRAFVEYHRKELFDISVLITEAYAEKPGNYPFSPATSPATIERAQRTLMELKQRGAAIHSAAESTSYEECSEKISRFLSEKEIDIAIFHESDVINLKAASLSDVPCKAFFLHSEGLHYAGFDLYICGDEELAKTYRSEGFSARIEIVPFALDVRRDWEADTPCLEPYGIPKSARVLTTISNQFEHRLSPIFCKTVSQLLEKHPDCYYAMIGKFCNSFEEFRRKHFPKEHWKRIIHFGPQPCPSHLARSMTLYLNEFPEGSGFAVLDAMAAGLPIVSMYDEEGTLYRRVGGGFFGKEHCIQTGYASDYLEKASALLSDPRLYREWKKYSLERYNSIVHPERDVQQIEDAAVDILKSRSSALT